MDIRKGKIMGRNGYPQGSLEDIEPEAVQQLVICLRELYDKGKPGTDAEVESRVNEYFAFCQNSSVRPGIESLCMALHISRTTLFNWARGIGCSQERKEIIEGARSFIGAYIEQAVLSGKISPPSGIFIMKNWLSYKDTISFEETMPREEARTALTAADLPKLGLLSGVGMSNE